MESFSYYKGYGIRYKQFGGNTYVEHNGCTVKIFYSSGEIAGDKLAKSYIDDIHKIIDCNEPY